MRVGIAVYCSECGRQKCPRGRSAPMTRSMCDFECSGYSQTPMVGDLWPGETDEEFGHPCGEQGTCEVTKYRGFHSGPTTIFDLKAKMQNESTS